ncbi:MAG: diadenylate cyclase CdaA [Candidatus Omnitrophota bacterium]
MEWIQSLQSHWKPIVEISVFWFVFYLIFVYIKDSGMSQALKGLAILGVFFFLSQMFELRSIRWILSHLFQISIIGILIIFQPELRRGLARIGQSPLFQAFAREGSVTDDLIKAVFSMARRKIGALIAIERETTLKAYTESGIALDGVLTKEMLITIFMPNTPSHDGGVIIQANRIAAVGCLFPLSQSQKISKMLGTRHRAALGLSEETDALVIVVSEETGVVSLMSQGKIMRELDETTLKDAVTEAEQARKSAVKTKRPVTPEGDS